jgi:CRP/FNR family transcriptional regulator, cyclic AMP receptor protein
MLFSALPRDLQEILRATASARQFSDGQLIQSRGDAPDGFWLIEEGQVSVGLFEPGGEFRAIAMLGPGDSYGELAMLSGRVRIVDAIARGPATLRAIRVAAFDSLLDQHPEAMRGLLAALALQLQDSIILLAGVGRGSARTRMARLLLNFAGKGPGAHSLTITQQELADLLGMTRATANQALCALESEGLIKRGYGTVGIPDGARLGVAART